jgi:hypothetical protein
MRLRWRRRRKSVLARCLIVTGAATGARKGLDKAEGPSLESSGTRRRCLVPRGAMFAGVPGSRGFRPEHVGRARGCTDAC